MLYDRENYERLKKCTFQSLTAQHCTYMYFVYYTCIIYTCTCTCIYVHVHVFVYLSIYDVQQLFQNHGDALVAQEVGHDVEMQRAHKALVETGNARDSISQLLGAIEEVDHTRAFGRSFTL